LLLKSPGVLLTCVLAAAVLSMAAASGVLFLASTGTAALHSEAAQEWPESSQPGIINDPGPNHYPSAQQNPSALTQADGSVCAAMSSAGLPPADLVATAAVAVSGDRASRAMLFARAGALAHVDVVKSVAVLATAGAVLAAGFFGTWRCSGYWIASRRASCSARENRLSRRWRQTTAAGAPLGCPHLTCPGTG
jgi:hypothetical protein